MTLCVGVQYSSGVLSFLLDASLTVGGLELGLLGLTMGSPLDHFAPVFDLWGIAIDVKRGSVEISGAIMKAHPTPDNVEFEYDGALIVRTQKLALVALGSYAKLKTGQPSLFGYLAVDAPVCGQGRGELLVL